MPSISSPTKLIHIVGPQGSGKSVLARTIAGGNSPRGLSSAIVDSEEALYFDNAALRQRFFDYHCVLVEAEEPGPRHQDLQPGDMVLTITSAR